MERKLRLALYIKMLLGFIIGFLIAYFAVLPYSYTAGVIAILHLWYSRDNVVKTAINRLISSLVGLSISALLFYLFGYNIYNLFFMVLCVLLALYLIGLESGAVIALVLVGQQWSEQTALAPLNALLIMLIGTGPALLLNLFTFKKSKILLTQQALLDQEIATIFTYFAKNEPYDFTKVNKILHDTRHSLAVATDNYRIENIMQAVRYINVRAEQIKILERVVTTLNLLHDSPFKQEIITYLLLFQDRIGTEDFATDLLAKHDVLVEHYRALSLPKTRDEFEHRAILYSVLLEIKQFLIIKVDYHKAFPTTLTS